MNFDGRQVFSVLILVRPETDISDAMFSGEGFCQLDFRVPPTWNGQAPAQGGSQFKLLPIYMHSWDAFCVPCWMMTDAGVCKISLCRREGA